MSMLPLPGQGRMKAFSPDETQGRVAEDPGGGCPPPASFISLGTA